MGKNQHCRYYRVVNLDYRFFEKFLNLPKGFSIDAISERPDIYALSIRIRCPEEERFAVGEGAVPTEISAVAHFNEVGLMDEISLPDLVQGEL